MAWEHSEEVTIYVQQYFMKPTARRYMSLTSKLLILFERLLNLIVRVEHTN